MRFPCLPASDPMLLLVASFLHFMLAWFWYRLQCNAFPDCNVDICGYHAHASAGLLREPCEVAAGPPLAWGARPLARSGPAGVYS